MKLALADEKMYPRLHRYVKNDLPTVFRVEKIVRALEKYGQIKRLELPKILAYGGPPSIKIVPLTSACGEFTPGNKLLVNEIRIEKSLVDKFERTKERQVCFLVGATLLHELSHWGDEKDGVDYPGEEGEFFEMAAYGNIIPCVL